MTALVLDYRDFLRARHWAKLDTSDPVVARVNGLPVTASDVSNMPSDVDPFDAAFLAPPEDCA